MRHAWPGAWVNSLFRNESDHLSSELIREAIAATRSRWEPPELGIVTFVTPARSDASAIPVAAYLRAGFKNVGETKAGWSRCNSYPPICPSRRARRPASITLETP